MQHSGILSHFVAGDLILTDKGFLILDDLPPGVALMTAQFTPDEIRQTCTIAKARIHVERAINRLKRYRILSHIAGTLRPFASVLFQVCELLLFRYPLIKEVKVKEDMYYNV